MKNPEETFFFEGGVPCRLNTFTIVIIIIITIIIIIIIIIMMV